MLRNINHRYLAVLAVLCLGVLSGCKYCIPMLVATIIIPVINYLTDRAFAMNTINQAEGVKS